MIRVFLGPGRVNLGNKVPNWPKNNRVSSRWPSTPEESYLLPSHRSGGFMGNPQPRGFRHAPLMPSGFFQLDPANQPAGERRRCSTRKIVEVWPVTPSGEGFTTAPTTREGINGSIPGTGGFNVHTHNGWLTIYPTGYIDVNWVRLLGEGRLLNPRTWWIKKF